MLSAGNGQLSIFWACRLINSASFGGAAECGWLGLPSPASRTVCKTLQQMLLSQLMDTLLTLLDCTAADQSCTWDLCAPFCM